jgi:hypothetical protein
MNEILIKTSIYLIRRNGYQTKINFIQVIFTQKKQGINLFRFSLPMKLDIKVLYNNK